MDFSTNVLIEFGLNLAGYLIVAALVYALVGRRRRTAPVEPPRAAMPAPTPVSVPRPTPAIRAGQPEFMSLTSSPLVRTEEVPDAPAPTRPAAGESKGKLTEATRRENREAIYREARRLLARGKSRGELLDRLPVTEGEIEMLTATGKA